MEAEKVQAELKKRHSEMGEEIPRFDGNEYWETRRS